MADLNKMTEREIQAHIGLLEKAKNGITEQLEEAKQRLEMMKNPKLVIPFIPENGEKYWYYSCSGEILDTSNDNYEEDINQAKTGKCFRTESEAGLAYEKRCAEAELVMMCDGLEDPTGCYIRYDASKGEFITDCSIVYAVTPYRFSTDESCSEAINKLGDRKLRLIFNIPLED